MLASNVPKESNRIIYFIVSLCVTIIEIAIATYMANIYSYVIIQKIMEKS